MPVKVIGVGNQYRGDDGVGLAAAGAVRELGLPDVVVCQHNGDGISLLETWQPGEMVILIDAVQTGAPAGTIRRIDAHRGPLPYPLPSCSSHSFGPDQAIELCRVLGRLPQTLVILAVEGQNFTIGAGLSTPVEAAVTPVVNYILALLAEWGQQVQSV